MNLVVLSTESHCSMFTLFWLPLVLGRYQVLLQQYRGNLNTCLLNNYLFIYLIKFEHFMSKLKYFIIIPKDFYIFLQEISTLVVRFSDLLGFLLEGWYGLVSMLLTSTRALERWRSKLKLQGSFRLIWCHLDII